jgi:hypothetical protein
VGDRERGRLLFNTCFVAISPSPTLPFSPSISSLRR